MPKPFKFTLKSENSDDTVISGQFDSTEHVILLNYLEQYEQLIQSKPLREGFPCSFTEKWEEGVGSTIKTSLPDNDTLSILLHRLRPFILQEEPASYLKTVSILGKQIKNNFIRQILKEERKLYDGRDAQQYLRISSNDILINSEETLYKWLNSHEYHRDPDKRKEIDTLLEQFPENLMKVLLVSMLVDKVESIKNIASIIAFIFGKIESLRF